MADLKAPRGMHDLLPEDEALWRFVRDTAERVARLFDYRLISTPIVEDGRVFLRTVGDESDIVSKEMYLFEDRGGDRLALRPEGTAAVCRAYLEHGMASRPQPVRLAYFGPMFRYDRPQAGRYRQLWQFGVECIGDGSPSADVEVIELQRTLYEELGLGDLTLRINSIGTAETRRRYVEALRAHLEPHVTTLSRDSQRRFETNVLRILDSKEDAQHPALLSAPSILDHLDEGDALHFTEVRALLDILGVAYQVDPRIVRGLDYYARTVWEFVPPSIVEQVHGQLEHGAVPLVSGVGADLQARVVREVSTQATVGAGGRYDGLIELLGGPHTPGVGFATGIERIMLNLRDRQTLVADPVVDLYVAPLSEAVQAAAMHAARRARAAGFAVRAGFPGRGLRAHFRAAEGAAARFIAIVGEAEAARDAVQLKALTGDSEQVEVAFDDLAAALAR
ncbi:MAG: histidine--tRNA ligase [Dehalococcoidia bacterium]